MQMHELDKNRARSHRVPFIYIKLGVPRLKKNQPNKYLMPEFFPNDGRSDYKHATQLKRSYITVISSENVTQCNHFTNVMPIIEDVTYDENFQKKIVIQLYKKKKSGTRKMFTTENSIRPRKIQGTWTSQPKTVFRVEHDFALSLPIETYNRQVFTVIKIVVIPKFRSGSKHQKSKLEATKNITKIVLKQVENYCDKSTLHGLKYIGDNSLSLAERYRRKFDKN